MTAHTEATRLTRDLKDRARALGFDECGISRAEPLDEEARRLETWLREGRHGSMSWMERHFEKRIDPRKLVDGARTVISVIESYYQDLRPTGDSQIGRISRYALSDDYHVVLKEKLTKLYEWLGDRVPDLHGRAFVDSAPVMDKAWAQRGGLGWIGKHTNLISRRSGSFFFIGELIVNVELETDGPVPDHCGSCTRCIDACPTDAIYRPYAVDATRCISYLTIEHREDDIPDELSSSFDNWIFGCDICQDVCPWNKFSRPAREERYLVRKGLVDTPLEEWAKLDAEGFNRTFRRSPVKRAKFDGFRRNVRLALENYRSKRGSP